MSIYIYVYIYKRRLVCWEIHLLYKTQDFPGFATFNDTGG
jgi:hypothetical protein